MTSIKDVVQGYCLRASDALAMYRKGREITWLAYSMANEAVEAVNYKALQKMLAAPECSVELNLLESLEGEVNRPDTFKSVALLADLHNIDVRQFYNKYKIAKGRSGVMYIAGVDDNQEVPFIVQGFIGRCLVVGPHVIARMRHKLWALHHRIELVALNSDRFTKSLVAFRKLFGFADGSNRYGSFLPYCRTTVGGDIESIVASTPLLNAIAANDSAKLPVPKSLDPDGLVQDFLSRNTHAYTEDNQIAFVETNSSDAAKQYLNSADPEALRIGQLVEVMISLRGFPTKNNRMAFAARIWAVRIVSRAPALRLFEIVNASVTSGTSSDDEDNSEFFVPRKKVRFNSSANKVKKPKIDSIRNDLSNTTYGFSFTRESVISVNNSKTATDLSTATGALIGTTHRRDADSEEISLVKVFANASLHNKDEEMCDPNDDVPRGD